MTPKENTDCLLIQLQIAGRRKRFKCKSFSLYGAFQSWTSGYFKGCLWFTLKIAFSLKPNQHQDLLDRFQAGEVKEEELQEQYDRYSLWKMGVIWTNTVFRLGDEGFLLAPYSPLLRLAKKHSKTVKLKGGFVPKRYAKILMKEGEEEAYKQVWPELKLA